MELTPRLPLAVVVVDLPDWRLGGWHYLGSLAATRDCSRRRSVEVADHVGQHLEEVELDRSMNGLAG